MRRKIWRILNFNSQNLIFVQFYSHLLSIISDTSLWESPSLRKRHILSSVYFYSVSFIYWFTIPPPIYKVSRWSCDEDVLFDLHLVCLTVYFKFKNCFFFLPRIDVKSVFPVRAGNFTKNDPSFEIFMMTNRSNAIVVSTCASTTCLFKKRDPHQRLNYDSNDKRISAVLVVWLMNAGDRLGHRLVTLI